MSESIPALEQLAESLSRLRAAIGSDRCPELRDHVEAVVRRLVDARDEWTADQRAARQLVEAQGETIVNSALILTELREAKVALEKKIEEHRRAEEQIRSLNAELERRVSERTAELEAANDRLRQEVASRRTAEDRLRHDALHDTLTGLANRQLLTERLIYCLQRAEHDPGFQYSVLFLDVDNFKLINDSLGHSVGDKLLVQMTTRLSAAMTSLQAGQRHGGFTISRLGGDEFIILLEELPNPASASVIAERLQSWLAEPFRLRGNDYFISTSIGIACGDANCRDPEAILRNADMAMYRAKHAGKARYAVFNEEMHGEVRARLSLENELRTAVEERQFKAHYQPIVSLETGRICGFEALARWTHPVSGEIEPGVFIPIAEETGLIVPLGRLMLEAACRQLKLWLEAVPKSRDLTMSVNVSSRELMESDFLATMENVLKETGVPSNQICLEITESCVIEAPSAIRPTLDGLKAMGVQLHMDDFGTGYSSLSCLHRFPFDTLKIDRSFVMNMDGNREYAAVVFAINTLARNLGMKVTAEGLGSQDHLAPVLALGCDYAQGYYFSKPVGARSATRLLQSTPPWISYGVFKATRQSVCATNLIQSVG